MQKIGSLLLVAFMSMFMFVSCSKEESALNNYDRTAMLTNIGENIIVPSFVNLSENADRLQQATENFSIDLQEENLQAIESAFVDTYKAWQHCNFYNFGPAFNNILRISANSYPTDVATILDNISTQDYDLKTADNLVAAGFPAIDYLLYGVSENSVDYFINNPEAVAYLTDIVTELDNTIQTVASQWQTEYINTFINANGTDVGGSVGLLFNELTLHIEKYVRDGKIGIPFGIRNLNEALPTYTESYYKGDIAKELCIETLEAVKKLMLGAGGTGFNDYLNAVDAQHIDSSLSEAVVTKIDNAIAKVNAIPGNLKDAVSENPTEVAETYAAMQEVTVIFKNDITSALGILITYQDNDGD